MWNLKNNTNQSIDKTEPDSQTQKTIYLMVTKGEREELRDKLGVWD